MVKVFNVSFLHAKTKNQIRDGLMYRKKKLKKNQGMLFHTGLKVSSFWMKNTFIPLDVLFLNKSGKILGYKENNKPHSLKSISIGKKSFYVLEMNSGWVKKNKAKVGDKIKIRKRKTRKKRGGVRRRGRQYHPLETLASNEMLELFRNTVTREFVPTAMDRCRSDDTKRCLSELLIAQGLPHHKNDFTVEQLDTYYGIIETCKPKDIFVPWNTQSGEGQGGGRKKKTRRKRGGQGKKNKQTRKRARQEKKGNKIYENRFNVGDAIRLEPHYEDDIHDEYSIWDVVSVRPEEMSYMYELESNDSSLRLSRPESHLREMPGFHHDENYYGGRRRGRRGGQRRIERFSYDWTEDIEGFEAFVKCAVWYKDDKNILYLGLVNIDEDYQGIHLCKPIVKYALKETIKEIKKDNNNKIIGEVEVASEKPEAAKNCYNESFKDLGFNKILEQSIGEHDISVDYIMQYELDSNTNLSWLNKNNLKPHSGDQYFK